MELGAKCQRLLAKISQEIEESGDYESGDISIRNIQKFSEITGKNLRLQKAQAIFSGPFGHTALVDTSEGKPEFSELFDRFSRGPIELEDSLTHDRWRIDCSSLLTCSGKDILYSLLKATSDDKLSAEIDSSSHAIEAYAKRWLQDNFQLEIENELSANENELPQDLLSREEQAASTRLLSLQADWNNIENWLHDTNLDRSAQGLPQLTISELIAADPEILTADPLRIELDEKTWSLLEKFRAELNLNQGSDSTPASLEDILHKLRNSENYKAIKRSTLISEKYKQITNNVHIQLTAYFKSWSLIPPIGKMEMMRGSRLDTKNIPVAGNMICSQFAFTIILRALGALENGLKKRYEDYLVANLSIAPDEAHAQAQKQTFLNIPSITKFELEAMTPEMVLKTLKPYLQPIPTPKIFQELIDLPDSFFEPAPIEDTLTNIRIFLARLTSGLSRKVLP